MASSEFIQDKIKLFEKKMTEAKRPDRFRQILKAYQLELVEIDRTNQTLMGKWN